MAHVRCSRRSRAPGPADAPRRRRPALRRPTPPPDAAPRRLTRACVRLRAADVRRGGAPLVSPRDGRGDHEDPFLWQDRRGHFHLLTHNQGEGNVCGARAAGATCGAHLYSRDSYTWAVGREPVYTASVALANGSLRAFATRQRGSAESSQRS